MMEVIEHPSLADAETGNGAIRHGFFTRKGGVSEGLYSSLNCGLGSNDAPDAVLRNRALVTAHLGGAETVLCTAYQIHSGEAPVVARPWPADAAPRVDAMATAKPGLMLGILTADCVPVLLADPQSRVIGAIHAGWRGALDGVLEAGVAAMLRLGATAGQIRAVLGPSIASESYEVGPEFPAPFLAREPGDADLFRPAPRAPHFLFDLSGYAARRLRAQGLGAVAATGQDSFADAERFFSYRRATVRGEADYGRCVSAIALAA
jgi:YfiH family protein